MSDELVINLAALVTLLVLMLYAIFGGADFGGGVWDFFAAGARKSQQRHAIAKAMGPVWEANHVWLIFVIVLLFTCFPKGYSALGIKLFVPFHLALVGIMLRGAAFVFRTYTRAAQVPAAANHIDTRWTAVFGAASVISPLLLGAAFGTVTSGDLRGDTIGTPTWLRPYAIACGLLALSTCAYLAAVFLCAETSGELRRDFRFRAILSGTTTAILAGAVLALAHREANWFFNRLLSAQSMPIVLTGIAFFIASAFAVFAGRYRFARWSAVGQIVLLLIGWGNAHRPYLVYPEFTLIEAAGSVQTIKFLLATLPLGAALIAPSLWFLFKVFKSGS